ncbi:WYL domain-containing protein [Lewinellaceae bacterium SD302]|nr:WYL domain-containing protein [Lewinellaceae bacterium SD302]
MATNKNALIRYRTIDRCLQNSARRWTLEDLIEACSDALYEYEGKHTNVSKRTVQLDIQLLRSDKLGYNAPIEVYDRKFYRYADPDFSITDIPLRSDDLDVISESVAMLRQFKDFSLFAELNGVIQKLEDKIHHETGKSNPIIHLEKNEDLKGLEYLDTLYQAISKKIMLRVTYQSFSARTPTTFSFVGFILKEYNNRWFLVGRKLEYPTILTLALDRIYALTLNLKADCPNFDFNADEYYKNTFGVTVLNERPAKVELLVDRRNAPYVLTKPLHASQQLVSRRDDGSILINLRVHLNYEFERLILGFGDSITVLKPAKLRKRIVGKLRGAIKKYGEDG